MFKNVWKYSIEDKYFYTKINVFQMQLFILLGDMFRSRSCKFHIIKSSLFLDQVDTYIFKIS